MNLKNINKNKCDGVDSKSGQAIPWVYSDIVKDHFFNPRNVLKDEIGYEYDGKGTSGDMACGDLMTVWIKVDPKTKKISECKWRTFGCASAIAATSMMSIIVTENGGMSLEEASDLKPEQIVERLGDLPAKKFHCSVLGNSALREAIEDYKKRLATSPTAVGLRLRSERGDSQT